MMLKYEVEVGGEAFGAKATVGTEMTFGYNSEWSSAATSSSSVSVSEQES